MKNCKNCGKPTGYGDWCDYHPECLSIRVEDEDGNIIVFPKRVNRFVNKGENHD